MRKRQAGYNYEDTPITSGPTSTGPTSTGPISTGIERRQATISGFHLTFEQLLNYSYKVDLLREFKGF